MGLASSFVVMSQEPHPRRPTSDAAPVDSAPRPVRRAGWAGLAAVGAAGLAAVSISNSGAAPTWPPVSGALEVTVFIFQTGLAAILGFSLQKAFFPDEVGRRRAAARWGLLLGAGLVLAAHAAPAVVRSLPASSFAVAAGMVALALGAMAGSSPEGGLWENNQPPSAELQRRVLDRHRALGVAPATAQPWKRGFDLLIALAALGLSLPAGWILALLLWWEDPGPILFVKNSVGLGGRNFRQLKFRTMVQDAEDKTGPIWAAEDDARILRVGRLLRKTALDELPQLLNILSGDMSVVGPRPQRTVLVAGYLEGLPEYAQRHSVRPGLSGLAQVAGHYYLTPRQKLRFDRLYVRHASLGFDLKLLAIAFLLVFWLRWRPGWDGKIPRRWLHSK